MTGIERQRHGRVPTSRESLDANRRGTLMYQARQWDASSNSSGVTQRTQETVVVGHWQATTTPSTALRHYSTLQTKFWIQIGHFHLMRLPLASYLLSGPLVSTLPVLQL